MKTMSSLHIDKKEKDTLILGVGPTQGLDDTALAAEAIHAINFTHPKIWITSMETIASSLLMLEKDVNLKQGTLKQKALLPKQR